MECEKIIFLRNLFLRAFVVGVLFDFFSWIATLGCGMPMPPGLSNDLSSTKKNWVRLL